MDESLGSGGLPADGQEIPLVCEFVIKKNGQGYDVREWGNIVFIMYPNSTFFIKCVPPVGNGVEELKFTGGMLKSYTTYQVKDQPGEGEVSAELVLSEFFDGSYSDATGEFAVRRFHSDEERPWFIGDFNFKLKHFPASGGEVDIEVESLIFQVQVNQKMTGV